MPLPTLKEARNIMTTLCAKVGTDVDVTRLKLAGKSGAELCGMFNDACWRALRRRSAAQFLIRQDFYGSDSDDNEEEDEKNNGYATPFAYSTKESDDESL